MFLFEFRHPSKYSLKYFPHKQSRTLMMFILALHPLFFPLNLSVSQTTCLPFWLLFYFSICHEKVKLHHGRFLANLFHNEVRKFVNNNFSLDLGANVLVSSLRNHKRVFWMLFFWAGKPYSTWKIIMIIF